MYLCEVIAVLYDLILVISLHIYTYMYICSFLGSSAGKEFACNAGDPGSIPGSGRSPGGGHGLLEEEPMPVFLPGESPWTEEPGGL